MTRTLMFLVPFVIAGCGGVSRRPAAAPPAPTTAKPAALATPAAPAAKPAAEAVKPAAPAAKAAPEAAAVAAAAARPRPELRPIFDGKTLQGWKVLGPGKFEVEGGEIRGRSDAESFLVTEKTYGD